VFSKFFGGSGQDFAHGVAVDGTGNVYIVGATTSLDFPTVNATQRISAGGFDGFASKLTPDGSSVLFSTFFGGTGDDYAGDVVVGGQGHRVYFTGITSTLGPAPSFPTAKAKPFQFGGGRFDAFIAELASADLSVSLTTSSSTQSFGIAAPMSRFERDGFQLADSTSSGSNVRIGSNVGISVGISNGTSGGTDPSNNDDADNAGVTVDLPPTVIYQSCVPISACTLNGSILTIGAGDSSTHVLTSGQTGNVTVFFKVGNNIADGTQINLNAKARSDTDDPNYANNIATLTLTVSSTSPGQSWTVSKTHISNFSAGQPTAFFTVTVSNIGGSGPTSGMVTVTEVPASNAGSFTMSGANWNCSGNTCTRSDALPVGSSYPPITVTMNLPADSSSQITNQVSVTGGGLAQSMATDVASIVPAFTDILSTDLFLPAIDLLRESGITTGCTPSTYCGNDNITQAQMAVFVVRSVMGSDNFSYTTTPYFTDEPATDLYFPWVQKMQDLGIALSCGTNQFCPNTPVTRGQMAVLIIRGRYGTSVPPNFPTTPAFTDVPGTYSYFSWIQKMKQVGITTGCSPTTYCPDTPVTRGQMAVFIMRGMFNLVPSGGVTQPMLSVAPASILTGQSVPITIQAQNSNFASGTTQVSAGPGITVSNVTVINATKLTAQFVAAANAAVGPRSILVTTGSQEATLPNVFIVSSSQ
jgi:hypothetical protein